MGESMEPEVSWGLPVLTLVWLLVLLNGCEDSNDLSIKRRPQIGKIASPQWLLRESFRCIVGSQSAAWEPQELGVV